MITLGAIVESKGFLAKLLETKLPIKLAYKLTRLVGRMAPDMKIYEDKRVSLVKELGEQTDPTKDIWDVKPENISKFIEELSKLQSVQVDLTLYDGQPFEKIKIEELGDVQIEPQTLINLDWLFE